MENMYVKTFEQFNVSPEDQDLNEGIFDSKEYDGHREAVKQPAYLAGVAAFVNKKADDLNKSQKDILVKGLEQISSEIGVDIIAAAGDVNSVEYKKLQRKNPEVISKLEKAYKKGDDPRNPVYRAIYFATNISDKNQSDVQSGGRATVATGFNHNTLAKYIADVFKK